MATKTTKKAKTWTNIDGEMRVFSNVFKKGKKEYTLYSTTIGVKDENGDYTNMYFNVSFPKDNKPETDGTFEINVTKGFLTLDIYNGKVTPKVVIQEYEEI